MQIQDKIQCFNKGKYWKGFTFYNYKGDIVQRILLLKKWNFKIFEKLKGKINLCNFHYLVNLVQKSNLKKIESWVNDCLNNENPHKNKVSLLKLIF